MNKKFKRALSSVLAFIMLWSCMCVMNVSCVFAATATYTITATSLPETLGSGKYYNLSGDSSGVATSSDTNPVADNNRGFYYVQGSATSPTLSTDSSETSINGLKLKKYIQDGSNTQGAVTFYANAGDAMTIYYKPTDNATTVGFSKSLSSKYGVTNAIATSKASGQKTNITSFTATASEDGVYYAGATYKSAKIYAITINRDFQYAGFVPSTSTDGSYYVIGKIAKSIVNGETGKSISEVGFNFMASTDSTVPTKVAISSVADEIVENGTTIYESNDEYYFAAFAVNNVTKDFVAVPFTTATDNSNSSTIDGTVEAISAPSSNT